MYQNPAFTIHVNKVLRAVFAASQRDRYGIVTRHNCREIGAEQLAALDANAAIDDTQVDFRWVTKYQCSQWIVNRAAGEAKCVKAEPDDVGRHARRQDADVVASKHCSAAACGKAQHVGGRYQRWRRHGLARPNGGRLVDSIGIVVDSHQCGGDHARTPVWEAGA